MKEENRKGKREIWLSGLPRCSRVAGGLSTFKRPAQAARPKLIKDQICQNWPKSDFGSISGHLDIAKLLKN